MFSFEGYLKIIVSYLPLWRNMLSNVFLNMREGHRRRLRVRENRMLTKMFGRKRDEATGVGEN
jgi:hypothetical protein